MKTAHYIGPILRPTTRPNCSSNETSKLVATYEQVARKVPQQIKPYLTKETKGGAHTGALGSLDNTIPFRDEKLLADAKSVGQKQLT